MQMNEIPEEECDDVLLALKSMYKVTQKLAFYFVPRDVMEEVLEASKLAERVIRQYKK